ncbi:MAG: glycosyltransferase family 2 protein [Ardenticatenaceae bacterium]|nr:glycosyltransferase family 2 protein [Ardenticatenaceae bacterium]
MTTWNKSFSSIDQSSEPRYNPSRAPQPGARALLGRKTINDERPFLSVVIPAYNEARRVPKNLRRILAYLQEQAYSFEVIIVDDGSTDQTVASVREITESDPRVHLVENPHFGKGYTVRTGMLAATGEIALFSDADLSAPIEELERLLPWFDLGYDVVIGSREGGGTRQRIGEPFYRHLMGRLFNLLVQLLAVRGVQDTQCGFKAMRAEVARDVFPRLRLYNGSSGPIRGSMVTAFDVELLFLAQKRGYKIREVPVEWHYGTESKVNPVRDSWRNFKDVATVRWNDLLGRYN